MASKMCDSVLIPKAPERRKSANVGGREEARGVQGTKCFNED